MSGKNVFKHVVDFPPSGIVSVCALIRSVDRNCFAFWRKNRKLMLVKDIGLTAERVRFAGHVLWFGLGLHKFLVANSSSRRWPASPSSRVLPVEPATLEEFQR